MKLTFENLYFGDEKEKIKVIFLKIFYFYMDKSSLKKISDFKVDKNSITFKDDSEKKVKNKFNILLEKGFSNLKNKMNNKKTIYIHQNSGIPLIGSLYFGIVDKGSSIIEVKPNTSCNLNCIFCSVDEGISSKKITDFVFEKDYLVDGLKRLIEYKGTKVDICINPHGEPLLYADLVPLINDISKIKNVGIISIITNGTLLTESYIDDLKKAGLTQINLSINSLDPNLAKKIEGTKYYNLNHVKNIINLIRKEKINLVLAPVYLKGINDKEIEKLIEFAKEIDCKILIQNFLINKHGRNPVKGLEMDSFFNMLKNLEIKHKTKLVLGDCGVIKTKELPLPFKKGDIIKARIVCEGRSKGEKLAVSNNRVISIPKCNKKGIISIRITRDKYNIFYGESV